MRLGSPDFDETVPRPVIAVSRDYPASFELDFHQHRRAQFLYAMRGVVAVSTPDGAWAAPSERGVWIPGGTPHAVRMVGEVSTRSVLIEADHLELGARCKVIGVTPLLRQLLVAAAAMPAEYDAQGRDGLVMALLVAELRRAPELPLCVPFPQTPALATRCQAFLERPSPHDTIDRWSAALGLSRRAFTRTFRRETGISFAQWRQRACLVAALPRLAAGEPVTTIALDLGYESPAAFATMFKRLTGQAPSRYQPDG
jgi:AraC-like DNA-binding protein